MSENKVIEPIGFTNGRLLSDEELEQVSGGMRCHGTLTGGGGGVPGPIRVEPDGDISCDF